MAWSQTAADQTGDLTGTPITVLTCTINVVAGQLITGFWMWGDSATSVSITDTQLNAYTLATASDTTDGSGQHIVGFFAIAASTGSITITATPTGGVADFCGLQVAAYSGNAAASVFEIANASHGGSDTAPTVSVTTPTTDGCLILACMQNVDGSAATMTLGAGYTAVSAGVANFFRAEQKTQSPHGAVTANFTLSISAFWQMSVMAFKPDAGGTVTMQGRTTKSITLLDIDSSTQSQTQFKGQPGSTPSGAGRRPRVFGSQVVEDDFDYFGNSVVIGAASPGIQAQTIPPVRVIANPVWEETEFSWSNAVVLTRPRGGSVPVTPKTLWQRTFTNQLVFEAPFDFAGAVVQTGAQAGTTPPPPQVVRHLSFVHTEVATQEQAARDFFPRFFGAWRSSPSHGSNNPPPATVLVRRIGFFGAGLR